MSNYDICTRIRKIIADDEDEDGIYIVEKGSAEDAVAATIFALRCLETGGVNEAKWAARRAYEALDDFVSHIDESKVNDEVNILSNHLVQRELIIQIETLQSLMFSDPAVAEIHEKSKLEAQYFLPWFKPVSYKNRANEQT